MKKRVSPAVAAVIIAVSLGLVIAASWHFASRFEPSSDIRPQLKEMNAGKVATEPVPLEMASQGASLMGSKNGNGSKKK